MMHVQRIDNDSALDRAALDEVQLFLGDKFPIIITLYLQDARKRLRVLTEAIGPERKTDQIIFAAHAIRAASAHLGVELLGYLAGTVETAMRTRPNEVSEAELRSWLNQMNQAFLDIENIFQPLCDEASPAPFMQKI